VVWTVDGKFVRFVLFPRISDVSERSIEVKNDLRRVLYGFEHGSGRQFDVIVDPKWAEGLKALNRLRYDKQPLVE
jgi:hypothetical protein